MKIKKLKEIRIGDRTFKITWDKKKGGGYFSFNENVIEMGTRQEDTVFMVLCHELLEICHIICNQRYHKPDHDNNYLFSYDHSGFDTSSALFSGAIEQFIIQPKIKKITKKKNETKKHKSLRNRKK